MNKEGFIPTTENITPKEIRQAPYSGRTAFLEEAIAEGTLDKLPNKSITVDQWNRIVDIGLLYCLNEDTAEQDLATLYGLKSRERIRQLNKKFIVGIWNNCSDELKNKYPLTTIPYGKPHSQISRERNSMSHGGLSVRIKEVALGREGEKGITDPSKIASELNIPLVKVLRRKEVLKGWGINLDESKHPTMIL